MEPSLPEELLLLALHDEHGSVIPSAVPVLNGPLVGAILMELTLRGRLADNLDGTLGIDPTPTGDEILDDVGQRIANAPRPQPGRAWVAQLNHQMPNLKDRLLARLVAAGMLEQRDRRVFWIFPSRSFPLADGAVEQQARDRVRAVVLDGATPDQRTAALITLVQACNLQDEVFAPHERPQALRRTVELTSDDAVESGTFGEGVGAAMLFGLAGVTMMYAFDRLGRSVGATADEDWSSTPNQTGISDWNDTAPTSSTTPDAGASDSGPSDSGSSWDSGGIDSSSDSGSSGCGS